MVGIVTGALVLAGAGTYLLAERGVRTDDAQNALRTARQVAAEVPLVLDIRSAQIRRAELTVLREADGVRFVTVDPGGALRGRVPSEIDRARLRPRRLLAGLPVSGTTGDLAFALVPVRGVPGSRLDDVPAGTKVGLLLVQRVPGARLGLAYLLLVSGGALVLAAAVATLISRRISRPLVDAVATTRRIAEGDLSARVPADDAAYPELESLTTSINTMAASLSRSRTLERQFLLSVSHDLRTPLTSILGYAEAIGDGTLTEARGGAAIIASEARRLERLVGDLLELARLDSQQFSLHVRPVDVAGVVRSAAEGLRPAVEEAGLRLDVLCGEPVNGETDPDRLSQVVANLVENACKFAASGVQVWAGADDRWVSVVVDDDGPGIPPPDHARVFQRFVQIGGRPPARQAGTGLGLAIVAELVAAMGGTVSVVSPTLGGRGTRMAVALPRYPPR
jgi:signal transduction histidine kinase